MYNYVFNARGHLAYQPRVNQPEPAPLPHEEVIPDPFALRARQWSSMPPELHPELDALCAKVLAQADSVPRAIHGTIRVFLPEERPDLVIKELITARAAFARLETGTTVRNFLIGEGSSNLEVPRSYMSGRCTLDDRLPISSREFHNEALYIDNLPLFNDPVCQLVRLFRKVYLNDLISKQQSVKSCAVGDELRDDNFPFFIRTEHGVKKLYIGLIDLEHLEVANKEGLITLARMFPYHLDIIKEERDLLRAQAEQNRLNGIETPENELEYLSVDDATLEAAADKGKQYLRAYTDHRDWLRQQGIPIEALRESTEIVPRRYDELISLVEQELLKLNQGVNDRFVRLKTNIEPCKDFFDDPVTTAKKLAPQIVALVLNSINIALEERKQREALREEAYDPNLHQVGARSIYIKRGCIEKDVRQLIKDNSRDQYHIETARQLSYVVLKHLEKAGDIFYCDEGLLTGGGWSIRY
jgi:hypothetical protein